MKTQVMVGLVAVLVVGSFIVKAGAEETTGKEAWGQIREEGKAARAEEMALRQQAREAYQSGDIEKAKALRAQLKETHQANMKEFKEKRGELREKRREMMDKREDRFDRREDVRDRREDVRDRLEDKYDATHDGGRLDKIEDRRDRREDVRDHREDVRDHSEDRRERRREAGAAHGGKKRK